jgi:hypothetical protein
MTRSGMFVVVCAVVTILGCSQQEDTEANDGVSTQPSADSLDRVSVSHIRSDMILDGPISAAQTNSEYTFSQGYPSGDTADSVYENSMRRRAIEAYKTFLPTVATEAVVQQMLGVGVMPNKTGIIMAQGPKQQFAAANSDTPYFLAVIDLRDGPVVIEMAANPLLLGIVNDHNMRWITNVGGIGPENGAGGKHLILPPDFSGSAPEGFYTTRSQTWVVVVAIRTVPLDGDVPKSLRAAADGITIYPLADPDAASVWQVEDITEQRLELPLLAWEGTLDYWRELHKVIQDEVPQDEDRYSIGALEQLGIAANEPFPQDEKLLSLLSDAARTAHAELAVSLYANNDPRRIMWEGRRWELFPLRTMHLPKGDFGTESLIAREASDQYFFFGWGTSSTIGLQEPGGGSVYYSAFMDDADIYLDGGKNYQMNIPGPVPAGLFWSVTVYDAETRCLIEAPLMRAAVRSHLDDPAANSDGSFDIYFGPSNPGTEERNWVQTLPGKGWMVSVRLYGPTEEVFDGTWKLSDIHQLE